MSPKRHVNWITRYQLVHFFHNKMEKCLNLPFLYRHSSEHNALQNMFLESQNHQISLAENIF